MIDMASLDDPAHGTIIMAGFQSGGRGRGRDRSWESVRGQNLLFTLALSPDKISHPLMRIPLICGLALTEYLRYELKLDAMLKWPNDVLVNEKKIAGILCEYRSSRFFLGMGVNCEQQEFDSSIKEKATSLRLQEASCSSPDEVLEGLLIYLKTRLERSEWKEDALHVLYKRNEEITVYEGLPGSETGLRLRIEDLSDDGFLIAREMSSGKTRLISAGEISFGAFK